MATAQCGSSFLLHHFVTIFSSYIGHAIFKCGVVHPCWKSNYNHYAGIGTILPIEGPIVFSQSVSIAWLTNLLMFCRWYILDRLICLIDPYRRSQTKITQWFQSDNPMTLKAEMTLKLKSTGFLWAKTPFCQCCSGYGLEQAFVLHFDGHLDHFYGFKVNFNHFL